MADFPSGPAAMPQYNHAAAPEEWIQYSSPGLSGSGSSTAGQSFHCRPGTGEYPPNVGAHKWQVLLGEGSPTALPAPPQSVPYIEERLQRWAGRSRFL